MVGRWGMSDVIGPIAVADGRSDGLLLPGPVATSEDTQRLVDEEVRRIVEEAEHDTVLLIERERPRLEALTRALLEQGDARPGRGLRDRRRAAARRRPAEAPAPA